MTRMNVKQSKLGEASVATAGCSRTDVLESAVKRLTTTTANESEPKIKMKRNANAMRLLNIPLDRPDDLIRSGGRLRPI